VSLASDAAVSATIASVTLWPTPSEIRNVASASAVVYTAPVTGSRSVTRSRPNVSTAASSYR
jgi:hypothetical protein